MHREVALLLLLVFASASTSRAADNLESLQQELAALEQQVGQVKRDDPKAIHALSRQAAAISLQLLRLPDQKDAKVKAARRRTTDLKLKLLELSETPDVVSVPKLSGAPQQQPSRGSKSSSRPNDAQLRKLDAMLARHKTPPRELNAGSKLRFTQRDAEALRQETERFTREFIAAKRQWQADLAEARTMPHTHHIAELESGVPRSLNHQVSYSRSYLETAFILSRRWATERLGLSKKIIDLRPGKDLIEFDESGATVEDCLLFAYQAATTGLFFEQQISGDPKPWLEGKQEIEAILRQTNQGK